MDAVVMPGDWNADGAHDVIARCTSDGGLWLYPCQPGSGLARSVQIGNGWQLMPVVASGISTATALSIWSAGAATAPCGCIPATAAGDSSAAGRSVMAGTS